jgi:exopolyphosphatase/guanosine-5'-triphosphate,3'-diphosphate pyrophosphatase
MRVAAIDCGTNSLRLLVADVIDNRLLDVTRRMEIVRLGRGVDRTGRIHPDSLQRTLGVLGEYAADVERLEVDRVRMVATSAVRDAANRADFVNGVQEILGREPEIVSGDAEAALSFTGATRELTTGAPYLVVDIGGGSTEFVLGREAVVASVSVDIGCVRLTERHLHGDPPTSDQVAATSADIDGALEAVWAVVPVTQARTLVGLAGSVTTVAALALSLPEYDAARIHRARISQGDVVTASERLLSLTHDERARLPFLHPGRVDVIGAGSLVLTRLMRRFNFAEVLVSEHDILDGIAWSMVDQVPPVPTER